MADPEAFPEALTHANVEVSLDNVSLDDVPLEPSLPAEQHFAEPSVLVESSEPVNDTEVPAILIEPVESSVSSVDCISTIDFSAIADSTVKPVKSEEPQEFIENCDSSVAVDPSETMNSGVELDQSSIAVKSSETAENEEPTSEDSPDVAQDEKETIQDSISDDPDEPLRLSNDTKSKLNVFEAAYVSTQSIESLESSETSLSSTPEPMEESVDTISQVKQSKEAPEPIDSSKSINSTAAPSIEKPDDIHKESDNEQSQSEDSQSDAADEDAVPLQSYVEFDPSVDLDDVSLDANLAIPEGKIPEMKSQSEDSQSDAAEEDAVPLQSYIEFDTAVDLDDVSLDADIAIPEGKIPEMKSQSEESDAAEDNPVPLGIGLQFDLDVSGPAKPQPTKDATGTATTKMVDSAPEPEGPVVEAAQPSAETIAEVEAEVEPEEAAPVEVEVPAEVPAAELPSKVTLVVDRDQLEENIFDDDEYEGDIFRDINEEEDVPGKKEELFGDSADNDLFGDDKKDDLFDDDEARDSINSIPVQQQDCDRVPYNTPAVGCALDDVKTAALLTAAKKEVQHSERNMTNGDSKSNSTVGISSFTRIGEGYNSYIIYTVHTATSLPEFKNSETDTQRRFSDFVTLHQLLVENYLPRGIIVPPSPEKNFMGTAKVRFGKTDAADDTNSNEFINRRKAALERYLNRLMAHHMICKDETLRRFLEEEESPKPNPNASGFKGFFKNVETMVNRATAKINEVDEWYEEKQTQLLELEENLKKLLCVLDNLVADRKDLGLKSNGFATSCAFLGEGEDNPSLSRALNKFAELQEKLDVIHREEADTDLFVLAETVKDYIALIQSAKAGFDERVRTFSSWEGAQATLAKKREAKTRAVSQGKSDRVEVAEDEIKQWEARVERCQEDFELISKTLKSEVKIFENQWVEEIKVKLIKYFQQVIEHQKQISNSWKEFLPEAKMIN